MPAFHSARSMRALWIVGVGSRLSPKLPGTEQVSLAWRAGTSPPAGEVYVLMVSQKDFSSPQPFAILDLSQPPRGISKRFLLSPTFQDPTAFRPRPAPPPRRPPAAARPESLPSCATSTSTTGSSRICCLESPPKRAEVPLREKAKNMELTPAGVCFPKRAEVPVVWRVSALWP